MEVKVDCSDEENLAWATDVESGVLARCIEVSGLDVGLVVPVVEDQLLEAVGGNCKLAACTSIDCTTDDGLGVVVVIEVQEHLEFLSFAGITDIKEAAACDST